MSIDELSKSQLLLLALLVSFITSIATGVLTVSLLEETPQTVTQTVNRVVERTIERVAPVEEGSSQGAAVITRETTVIVKEDEVLSDSVAAHARRVVTLHSATTTAPATGLGLVFPRRGLIATVTGAIPAEQPFALFSGGQFIELEVVSSGSSRDSIALLRPKLAEGQTMPSVASYEIAATSSLRRAQSVSSLTARGAVETGIISFVGESGIETNLTASRLPLGATLITTQGHVAGMYVRAPSTGALATFLPAGDLVAAIDAFLSQGTETASTNR